VISVVQFGIRLPQNAAEYPGASSASLLDIARLAEDLGYYSVWVHDHIATTFALYDPIIVMSFIGNATNSVKLGSACLLMGLRNAVLLAKQTASIDDLTNGRLIVGATPGWMEKDFEAAGISLSERGRRTDEGIAVMKKLWTETDAILPQPVQKPHPPVWIGGTGPASISRVARLGGGWIPGYIEPSQVAHGMAEIKEKLKETGRASERIVCSNESLVGVISNGAADMETVKRFLQSRFKTIDEGLKRNIVGPPDEIIKKIQYYVGAGATHFELRFIARDMNSIATSMKVFSRDIAPSF
jgi:alkanesulfonate monooxygenase SsuD/methylene tetrahydromethanopterin reductase-like flavin-dependent oxidoreductase (luciferase family)